MRYFNVKQHVVADMFSIHERVDVEQLEQLAKEISWEQANQRPSWGSGNIAVDKKGNWYDIFTNFDSSD